MHSKTSIALKTGIIASMISTFFITAPLSFAAVNTIARGNVYNNGVNVPNVPVTVSCVFDNGKAIIKNKNTDSNGLYSVNFTSKECDQGGAVTASATVNGVTQTETSYVSDVDTVTNDFNFGSDPINVPEFSTLTGAIAVLGAAGSFILLRNKRII